MSNEDGEQEPPKKRPRMGGSIDMLTNSASRLPSLTEPISPPRFRGSRLVRSQAPTQEPVIIPSPFQLTRIQDLSPSQNVDTLTLNDILGSPLISECWEFNYLHDIDFLMSHFDEDIRHLVKVHVVHGFWKHEDAAELKVCNHLDAYYVNPTLVKKYGTQEY